MGFGYLQIDAMRLPACTILPWTLAPQALDIAASLGVLTLSLVVAAERNGL